MYHTTNSFNRIQRKMKETGNTQSQEAWTWFWTQQSQGDETQRTWNHRPRLAAKPASCSCRRLHHSLGKSGFKKKNVFFIFQLPLTCSINFKCTTQWSGICITYEVIVPVNPAPIRRHSQLSPYCWLFPMLGSTSPWLLRNYQLVPLTPLPCFMHLPPPHPATIKILSASMSLFLFCLFIPFRRFHTQVKSCDREGWGFESDGDSVTSVRHKIPKLQEGIGKQWQ